jgi:chemotaxis protein methyltransferase CheR
MSASSPTGPRSRLPSRGAPAREEESFSAEQFESVRAIALERFGLHLGAHKRELVHNRLLKLVRRTGESSLDSLIAAFRSQPSRQMELALFDVLSTNQTHFFREREAYDCLVREVVQPLVRARGRKRLRIWSAGCSTGCEPYSIGIVLHEAIPDLAAWDARVLATDLSVSTLEIAARATYPRELVSTLPENLVDKYFRASEEDPAGLVQVADHVRALVTFGLVNLMEKWAMRGPFDAIFCRNVIIYFDPAGRAGVLARFEEMLRPGGVLFLGSSESLSPVRPGLQRVGDSAYRKL